MARKVISLSIPESLLDRMDEHVALSDYTSISEYVRELIRNDLRQNADEPVPRFGERADRSKPRFRGPVNRW